MDSSSSIPLNSHRSWEESPSLCSGSDKEDLGGIGKLGIWLGKGKRGLIQERMGQEKQGTSEMRA